MVFKYDSADVQVAEDLMSDTILQALQRFDSLQHKEALLSFCFTIASRCYKAQFVRRKYWGLYEQEVVERISSHDATPDVSTDAILLYEALDKLPLRIREAVVLFEISDLSLESVRAIQGGTISGVKSRVTRGRVMLARLLGADGSSSRHNIKDGTIVSDDENRNYTLQRAQLLENH